MTPHTSPTSADEFQVFTAWSEEAVAQALDEFKTQMYGGADIDELKGGLRCLEFLTEKSELSPALREDIDNAADQARFRIQLMHLHPDVLAAEKNSADTLQKACAGVEQLRRLVNAYEDRFLHGRIGYAGDPDAIWRAVELRVARRHALAA